MFFSQSFQIKNCETEDRTKVCIASYWTGSVKEGCVSGKEMGSNAYTFTRLVRVKFVKCLKWFVDANIIITVETATGVARGDQRGHGPPKI